MKLGDKVTWSSQSGGYMATKTGEIIEVVPCDAVPRCAETTLPRGHESYVVMVRPAKGNAKPKKYWPRVSALKLVTE